MLTQIINARILTPQGWLKEWISAYSRQQNSGSNQL